MDIIEIEGKLDSSKVEDSQILEWVEKIRLYHAEVVESDKKVVSHKQRCLEKALLCGEYLNKCKKEFKHGQFSPFLQTQFNGHPSHRTCNRYMRLDEGKEELTGVFSLRQGYIRLKIINNDPTEEDLFISSTKSYQSPNESGQTENDNTDTTDQTESENSDEELNKGMDSTKKKVKIKEPHRWKPELVILFKPSSDEVKKGTRPFMEFRIGDDGELSGTNPETQEPIVIEQGGVDWMFQFMTRFLRWYQLESDKRRNLISPLMLNSGEPIPVEESTEQSLVG